MSLAVKDVVRGARMLFSRSSFARVRKVTSSASTTPVLVDRFSRTHNYLRISLTERCNLRCKSVFEEYETTH